MTNLTNTKKRGITKKLRAIHNGEEPGTSPKRGQVTVRDLEAISKKFGVAIGQVETTADELGIMAVALPAERKVNRKPRTSPKQREGIKAGHIFKVAKTGQGKQPKDTDLVITNYAALKRERAAILDWIADVRDGLA